MSVTQRGFVLVLFAGLVSVQAHSDEPFKLHTPIEGKEMVDWAINYHVDHDRRGGEFRDFKGGTATYDGHKGVDFNIANFRAMDAGVAVLAAAPGQVVETRDDQFDRNTTRRDCRERGVKNNHVIIRHDNGYISTYAHLRKGSVVVSAGQRVDAKQKLGLVGSSGCSADAHLHFELENEFGDIIDPFKYDLWIDPPSYDYPTFILGYSVNARKLESGSDIKDPLPNIDTITPGTLVSSCP